LSPVRDLVKIVKSSTSDYKELVNIRGATSGWVGESGARTATATPSLREVTPTHGELYAYPQASEWSLDDIFFDVESWLAENVAYEFSVLEGDAVIRGNGVAKPTGMLNTAPTNQDDAFPPVRNAAAYQFVPNVDAGLALKPDAIIDLLYKVNATYRTNAVWVMSSATAAAVRKLKDGQNNYLWAPQFVAGQPETLLGYPVVIWEQMDAVSANTHPIAFGNFARGYLLVDRVGLRITVDANITTPGRIKYFIRRREGGHVLNGDAVKFLKCAAS
jgi:HK97 family phage major capsid protein